MGTLHQAQSNSGLLARTQSQMLEKLNDKFGIDNVLGFEVGDGGLAKAVIIGEHGSAEVYLHGGHVTKFQPAGGRSMLWMSSNSAFSADRPIRGGVPICWPWFGKPSSEKIQHGFARTSPWEVSESRVGTDGDVHLELRLRDSEASRQHWDYRFELLLRVQIGQQLAIRLTYRNLGDEPCQVTGALHTYFHVSHIDQVSLEGLDGKTYLDQLDQMAERQQQGAVLFNQEVDRIYLDDSNELYIRDRGADQDIRVTSHGSQSTVVWNPWIEKAKRMQDFPDDGYLSMVCVETANAAGDMRTVDPAQEHSLGQVCRFIE